MSRFSGWLVLACLVAFGSEPVSAQGYRYGIESNGFNKGFSAQQLQPRQIGPTPGRVYQSYSNQGHASGYNQHYGSYRLPYGGTTNVYVQPNYGYGYGYGPNVGYGYGYGYPYGNYPYYGGTTYGTQLDIYPGGLYQYYQGPMPYGFGR